MTIMRWTAASPVLRPSLLTRETWGHGAGEIARHHFEAVARLRRERRERLSRLAASVYRSLLFVNKGAEAGLARTKAPQTA